MFGYPHPRVALFEIDGWPVATQPAQAGTDYIPCTFSAYPLAIIVTRQFLMELDKPLGAAGNHALAGRYATMLKSAPDFDYTFTKASIFK